MIASLVSSRLLAVGKREGDRSLFNVSRVSDWRYFLVIDCIFNRSIIYTADVPFLFTA